MAGIVVITTKGDAKRDFANTLYNETDRAVKLVILQNVKQKSFVKRITSFYKKVGLTGIVPEIYYFISLKLSTKKKLALSLVSTRSDVEGRKDGYLAETLDTNDVNESVVYERVRQLSPDLIVIWGGYIIKSRLLETARQVINIHSGFVPYYRGVNGIQNAIINNDFGHIGITIHYAVSKVDAGRVIKIIQADYRQHPRAFFRSLNDQAFREYLNVAKEIFKNGMMNSEQQDLSKGRNFLLTEWTYQKQNALAKKIQEWSINTTTGH